MKFSQIKNYKLILIIMLSIIIIILIFINPLKKEVSFELDDRCGPIMNMISHSIKDEYACRSQCRSQCGVKDLEFSRIKFHEAKLGCNNCTCFCK